MPSQDVIETKECIICFHAERADGTAADFFPLRCAHSVHCWCLLEWLRRLPNNNWNCPYCQQSILTRLPVSYQATIVADAWWVVDPDDQVITETQTAQTQISVPDLHPERPGWFAGTLDLNKWAHPITEIYCVITPMLSTRLSVGVQVNEHGSDSGICEKEDVDLPTHVDSQVTLILSNFARVTQQTRATVSRENGSTICKCAV